MFSSSLFRFRTSPLALSPLDSWLAFDDTSTLGRAPKIGWYSALWKSTSSEERVPSTLPSMTIAYRGAPFVLSKL